MKANKRQKWLRLKDDYGWQIIIPDFDSEPHSSQKKGNDRDLSYFDCPCKPEIDALNKIIVHNSFIDKKRIDESIKLIHR